MSAVLVLRHWSTSLYLQIWCRSAMHTFKLIVDASSKGMQYQNIWELDHSWLWNSLVSNTTVFDWIELDGYTSLWLNEPYLICLWGNFDLFQGLGQVMCTLLTTFSESELKSISVNNWHIACIQFASCLRPIGILWLLRWFCDLFAEVNVMELLYVGFDNYSVCICWKDRAISLCP